MKKFVKVIAFVMALTMIVALFGCSKEEEFVTTTKAPAKTTTAVETTEPVTEAPKATNPFTGSTSFRKGAVDVRPVAIVVENLEPARPQWGIETPDILIEGEVEGGISRMLWLYADYKKVPEKVGPIRSARPSFVQFSEMFDAIFIHWGGSHSKASYVGGYETFTKDKVAHIDGMSGGALFGRDTTRNTSSEHRGILYGNKIDDAIKAKGYRTKLSKKHFPNFTFNEKSVKLGTKNADNISFKFSSRTDTRYFDYQAKDKKYHCSDWKTDVSFKNVIIIQTKSTYITTPYKGSSTTYLNYDIKDAEGVGCYASNGTIIDINWSTKSGTLVITDKEGNDLSFNKGNSYIGLCSNNNNGWVSVS